jgi:F-type H+-transporting ATPase subunit delta
MTTSALAKRYARAILELAQEQSQVDRVAKELGEFAAMWQSSIELKSLYANPEFGADVRKSALSELLTRAAVSPLTRNSVLYLADKNRLTSIAEIAAAFSELSERAAGTLRAEVTSAAALPDTYYAPLQKALEAATGRKISIEKKTDASLIAGVVTRVGDQVFDGSLRTRLTELKDSLKSA